MGIDTLALMMAESPIKAKTESMILKELGVGGGDSKQS